MLWLKLILVAAIAILQYLDAPHARAQCPEGYRTPVRDLIASRPMHSLLQLRQERLDAGVAFTPVRSLAYCTPVRSFVGACAEGRREQIEMGQPWTPIRNFLGRRNR